MPASARLTALLISFAHSVLHAADSDALFSADRLIPISIRIPEPQLEKLRHAPREYVAATLRNGTNPWAATQLRLKGNWTFRPIDDKPGFSLNLSPDALPQFSGHQRLLLNNSLQDLSFLRCKLASEFFLDAGLPTARLNFATVTLNGRPLGLYLLAEGIDARFLKNHFGSSHGNLYEGADTDIHQPLEIDSSTRPGEDRSDLQKLLAACTEPDLARRWPRLHQNLDIHKFASFMAMELLVAHIDGYCMDRNNYRLYHHDQSGKFAFIAHGMDLTFLRPVIRQDRRWRGTVAIAFIETPQGKQMLHQRLQELGRKIYGDPAALEKRLTDLSALITPALSPAEKQKVPAALAELRAILQRRAQSFPRFLEQFEQQ